jgi:hypothetical protein
MLPPMTPKESKETASKKVFHEQLEEDAVEDTWRRRDRPLVNTALDNFGVESVRNNFRPVAFLAALPA